MLKRETLFESFWNIQRNCGVLLVPNQKVYKEASKDWNRKCMTACFVQIFRILKNCFLKFISNNLIKNFVDFCIMFMDTFQLFAVVVSCNLSMDIWQNSSMTLISILIIEEKMTILSNLIKFLQSWKRILQTQQVPN